MKLHLVENMKGPPQFNVGLKPIDEKGWLLPDDGAYFLTQKNKLLDNEPVFAAFDNSIKEQEEVAELIAQHLGINLNGDQPPLKEISRYISDDLIIMAKRDGEWKLIALTLCSPTFFSAQFAIGKSLHILHDPIPDGDFKLASRIERVFNNMQANAILERFNWTIQWSDKRYTPDGSVLREMADNGDLNDAINMLHERVERQTIRQLPKTGAILFTIRIRLTHIHKIIDDENAKEALRNAWQNAPENVRQYKKWSHLERHVNYLLQK